jgi:hypothetical protein
LATGRSDGGADEAQRAPEPCGSAYGQHRPSLASQQRAVDHGRLSDRVIGSSEKDDARRPIPRRPISSGPGEGSSSLHWAWSSGPTRLASTLGGCVIDVEVGGSVR